MDDAALPLPDPSPGFAPPANAAELVDWLRLIRSPRVGATTFLRLMREHGTAARALDALPEVARAAGVEDYRPCDPDPARSELTRGRAAGARPLCLGAPDYPAPLADISDPPPILWALGGPALAARTTIGLVGARNASALGCRMAAHLARQLGAEGMVVVSGLARGIDAAAHAAALETGTIAVVAGGIDVVYPRDNTALAARIATEGLVLTEMPPGLAPRSQHFPRRNRIISGLCPALVVVEGAAKSGSLITARTALDQGREVMAVPGHPFDPRAAGCNMLIRDGATLVRSADDIAAALALPPTARAVPAPTRPPPAPAEPPRPPSPRGIPAEIMDRLSTAPISEDALIRAVGAPAPAVLSALAELHIEGRVERHPGGLVSAGPG